MKNPPAVQETWVQSLGWEDPLEKGVATHPSILCLENPEEPGRTQSRNVTKSLDTTERISKMVTEFQFDQIKKFQIDRKSVV